MTFIDSLYDNIKSHEKLGLYPLTRRYIFGENTKWGQVDLSAISRLRKETMVYRNTRLGN